jgi:uncharacterized Zn-binding protein involved in type VI secretion
MPAVQRLGDRDTGGGVITSAIKSVRVNNLPVSVNGCTVSPHNSRPTHVPVTANGIKNVRVGNRPINVTGNADTCGHARTGGSENVRVS